MFYKMVRDGAGKLINYRQLFERHAYDVQPAGMTIHTNTKQEITDAITEFLKDVKRPWNEGYADFDDDSFPDHTFIHHARGRLSPAFARLFEPSKVTVDAVGKGFTLDLCSKKRS